MRYLVTFLFLSLFLAACDNARHTIGVRGKPLSTDNKFEDSVKFNYKITFGKIRSNKEEDDED